LLIKDRNLYIIGHRGSPTLEPENTLRSFARAVADGAHGIECDVHVVENQVVVIHDDSIDRTSNRTGKLSKFTFHELRTFDFGQGETIPTLEEVINTTPVNTLLNVELKGIGSGEYVASIIREFPEHTIMISSFHIAELISFRKYVRRGRNSRIGILAVILDDDIITEGQRLQVDSLIVSDIGLDENRVTTVRSLGLILMVFTVNNLGRGHQLNNWGISVIITDIPHCFIQDPRF